MKVALWSACCYVSCTSQDHVCLLLSAFLSTTCFSDLTDVNSGSLDCALWLHCCQLAALLSTDGRSVWAVLIVQVQPVVVASSLTFLGSAAGQCIVCRVYTLCPPAQAPAPRPGTPISWPRAGACSHVMFGAQS